jgi:hypothetical protein
VFWVNFASEFYVRPVRFGKWYPAICVASLPDVLFGGYTQISQLLFVISYS